MSASLQKLHDEIRQELRPLVQRAWDRFKTYFFALTDDVLQEIGGATGTTPVAAKTAAVVPEAACEHSERGGCSGAVTTRPCPNGCGFNVSLCETHGGGRQFGGKLAAHIRTHKRPREQSDASDEDHVGVVIPFARPVPPPLHIPPRTAAVPSELMPGPERLPAPTAVKCAVDCDDTKLPCGVVVPVEDMRAHLVEHGLSGSVAPELHFVATDAALASEPRRRPLTWRLPRRRLELLTDVPEDMTPRPKSRSECRGGPRPCPWVGCRFHLAIDVKANGAIVRNFPGRDFDEIPQTCALDVADAADPDGITLTEVGMMLGLTRERTRQLVMMAIQSLRQHVGEDTLKAMLAEWSAKESDDGGDSE